MTHVTNFQRAHWASVAIAAFRLEVGTDDDESSIHDLIADLGHYCSHNELDFIRVTADAISCWAVERAHPGDDDIGPSPNVSIIVSGRKHPMRPWRSPAVTGKRSPGKGRGGVR